MGAPLKYITKECVPKDLGIYFAKGNVQLRIDQPSHTAHQSGGVFFKPKDFHTYTHVNAHAHPEIAVLGFLSLKLASAGIPQKLKHYPGAQGLEIQFLDC